MSGRHHGRNNLQDYVIIKGSYFEHKVPIKVTFSTGSRANSRSRSGSRDRLDGSRRGGTDHWTKPPTFGQLPKEDTENGDTSNRLFRSRQKSTSRGRLGGGGGYHSSGGSSNKYNRLRRSQEYDDLEDDYGGDQDNHHTQLLSRNENLSSQNRRLKEKVKTLEIEKIYCLTFNPLFLAKLQGVKIISF